MVSNGVGTHGLIDQYIEQLDAINRAIDREKIDQAVEILFAAWQSSSTVYTMGNGGSASTASHFACDLAKFTICAGKPRIKAMSLVDNVPLVSAWTNDNGFGSVFAEQLEPWLRTGDVVIGISVHGGSGTGEVGAWSQNLPRAAAFARERGAWVIGLSGFGGGALSELADVCLTVPLDSEPFGTPLIESYHLTLHHLICLALKQRITAADA